jgi:hypothetical protein
MFKAAVAGFLCRRKPAEEKPVDIGIVQMEASLNVEEFWLESMDHELLRLRQLRDMIQDRLMAPVVWSDTEEVLAVLDDYIDDLDSYREIIRGIYQIGKDHVQEWHQKNPSP